MKEFSTEDIINSVEYQWRKHQAIFYLIIWMIVSGVTLFVTLFVCFNDLRMIGYGMLVWLGLVLLYGVIFGSFSLYFYSRARYLKKNYKKFLSYEVKLDTISISYMYRRSAYYSVTIESRKVDTNPIFSSSMFSKFNLEEYNNKKVIGLFDEALNKFYILKKVD